MTTNPRHAKTIEDAIEDTKKDIEEERKRIIDNCGNKLDMLEAELKALKEREYLLMNAIVEKHSPGMMRVKMAYIVTNFPIFILLIFSAIYEIDVLTGISIAYLAVGTICLFAYVKIHVRRVRKTFNVMIVKSVAEIDDFISEFGEDKLI